MTELLLGNTQTINTGYLPRPLQRKLHQDLRRFNVLVCHRRFGKTVFCINHMIDRALRHTMPMPRFAYIAPTFGQAKRIAWDYLKKYTSMIPGAVPNEQDLRVDFAHNQARIMLLSAENAENNKGVYLDGTLLDEYGSMNPSVWREVIRPTLSDRMGWATFIGTPKGQNHFYELREKAKRGDDPEWFSALYKASETGIIPKSELESARRDMTEEEYNQEYECDFNAGLVGAYFAKELTKAETEGRITTVGYDQMLPVDTYWDLGINDMCAIWFVQSLRGQHKVIDYLEVSGASIPEVIAEVKKKNYAHGEWVFPHDAQARDFSTGKSQIQVLANLGCRPNRIIPRVGTKRESINAARMIFGSCVFDANRCARGLKALANYQRKWDEKNNVFQETPLHNWASNGADAFQQFGMGAREDSRRISIPGREYSYDGRSPLVAETEYDPYSYGGE
jgi:phage terminase large subunit